MAEERLARDFDGDARVCFAKGVQILHVRAACEAEGFDNIFLNKSGAVPLHEARKEQTQATDDGHSSGFVKIYLR